MTADERFEVIIIGGGPAGQSAALILGRSCRKVLVIDSDKPRNRFAKNMQGFITRDGLPPLEFLEIAKRELSRYEIVWHDGEAREVEQLEEGFKVHCSEGKTFESRKVLITTGVVDRIPEIEGIDQFYGDSIHHCPYCHAWEVRQSSVAVYGRGKSGVTLSLTLRGWTEDVILFTDGNRRVLKKHANLLEANNVQVVHEKIARLEGTGGKLSAVVLENGERIPRSAMFFTTGNDPHCDIPHQLGCKVTRSDAVRVNRKQETSVPGVYMAGDAAWDMQLVVVAAAEGAKAGVALNTELLEEDRINPRPPEN